MIHISREHDIQSNVISFELGIKPALFESKTIYEKYPRLVQYPSLEDSNIQKITMNPEQPAVIIFQDEERKVEFLKQVEGIKNPHDLRFHRALGKALGFPPKAIETFIRAKEQIDAGITTEKATKELVGLHYSGVFCTGSIHDLHDNVKWMWDNYPPILGDLQISDRTSEPNIRYKIPEQDFDQLEQARKQIGNNMKRKNSRDIRRKYLSSMLNRTGRKIESIFKRDSREQEK